MLERRRSPRLAYFTSARLENASGAWDGSVRDISAEGMFLETPRKFKAGERLIPITNGVRESFFRLGTSNP